MQSTLPNCYNGLLRIVLFLQSTLVFHSFESLFSRIRIHLFIFIWSYTSSWQDLKGFIKYYRLEVQLAYLVDFARFLLRFAPHLTFLYSKLGLHSLESFLQEYIYIYFFIWSCTSSWQDLERLRIYNPLEVPAYLIDFATAYFKFFTFWHSIQSYTTLESFFS